MHHYYNLTNKMSVWNSVIFALFTTVTVALSIIFAPVIASAMSGIILSGGALLEISALIMIPLAINYGDTLLEAVDIIFDSKKSVMERISAIGYLVAQLVTFWSASKASKGISKSATKSTGAPKNAAARRAYLNKKFGRSGNLHTDINARQEAFYDALASQHINGSGKTVLGTFRGAKVSYIKKAKNMGASYFDIGNQWYKVPKAQRWGINQRFLKKVTDAGDQIFFNIPKTKIGPQNIYSLKEIDFLTNKAGYKWINQWSLKKH